MADIPEALSPKLTKDRAYYADQLAGAQSGAYRLKHLLPGGGDKDVTHELIPLLERLVAELDAIVAWMRADA